MKNILDCKSVLFLGVGGVSMHQLALAFKNLGADVFGYDAKFSAYTNECEQNGIKVTNKFVKSFCSVELCVKNGAIKDDNKYIKTLKQQNVPIIDRATLLGEMCKKFKTVIAVAGTHGKSTTASLIYEMLRFAGRKVSCHIGADVDFARFNLQDDFLVVEACEFNKSFLSLYPQISIITNIEKEHMDSYKSMFNLKTSFLTFLKRGEKRFVYLDKTTKFLKKYNNITFVEKIKLKINPKLKGEHNLKNISLAAKVASSLGVSENDIVCVVNSFKGIPRRYEYIGDSKFGKVYIDYAHHPTEIKSFALTFLSEFKNATIVFQPHTYSRTKMLVKEFISVLSGIKNIVIYKEYPARETKDKGLSAKELYLLVKEKNDCVQYVDNLSKLNKALCPCDAVAFVGAGDINVVAKKITLKN